VPNWEYLSNFLLEKGRNTSDQEIGPPPTLKRGCTPVLNLQSIVYLSHSVLICVINYNRGDAARFRRPTTRGRQERFQCGVTPSH